MNRVNELERMVGRLTMENDFLKSSCRPPYLQYQFSAHRTPEAFTRWFKQTYPDRAKAMVQKAQTMMTERQAVAEFISSVGLERFQPLT